MMMEDDTMRHTLFRRAAVAASALAVAVAAPASAQWAVIDGSNLIQNTRSAIQSIDQLLEMKRQGTQAISNAKRLTNLDSMLSQVRRTTSQLDDEQLRSVANEVYRTNPGAPGALARIQAQLRAQGGPAAKDNALSRLSAALGASRADAALGNYSGMYSRSDTAANLTRGIADVETDRASLARSIDDYAAQGSRLGDNNLAASVQHMATGNLLNARQMNKMMEAQNLVAQQNQESMNRELAQESARLESHIRAIQKANAAQNVTLSDISARPVQ
ncbi:hypothetical protein [Sphingomonas sp. BK345]|uniref:hypothetical protein n=1 Tax=Sphingomonas sp. BK345 TaxID=2586980 RepID=UPI00160B2324|nr:hypothetical protein [Sphingomonas sp. BK345]MBB3475837.1 DNA-binding transcriptional MerR regulator [Sphingomonas sp. BK345]